MTQKTGHLRRADLTGGEASGHGVSTNVFPAARRNRWCPWLGRGMARAPLLACMAARRRCSPWTGHSVRVEHSCSTVGARSGHPEHNMHKNKRKGAEKGGFQCGGSLRRDRMNSGKPLRSHGGLPPRLSVRRGLPRRWRTQRWAWHARWPVETAGGERRSSASNVATAELGVGVAAGEGGGDRENGGAWGSGVASRPGHASRSRAVVATSPTYGRHVASVGSRRAGRARTRGGGETVGRACERAEREAGRPSSACPLSLFLNFFFPKEFKCKF
jgi:hypothetical protein